MELCEIKGVGDKTLQKLNAAGIFTPADVAYRFPRGYKDMTRIVAPSAVDTNSSALFCGRLITLGKVFAARGMKIFRAVFDCCGERLDAVWFNSIFVRPLLREGVEYCLFGRLTRKGKSCEVVNPAIEMADERKRLIGVAGVYPSNVGVTQGVFAAIAGRCLDACDFAGILDEYEPMSTREALRCVHFPPDIAAARRAGERLALESLTYRLLAYKINKSKGAYKRGIKYGRNGHCIDDVIAALPYELTPSQRVALREIIDDMAGDTRLNRMLVGDVGSGKTVVALLACCYCVRCGRQAVLMAPTELLAMQHYATAQKLLGGLRIALAVGEASAAEKRRVAARVANGEVDLLIGTHAVLGDAFTFPSLGLVVVDELQRFGVKQKSRLEDKAADTDVLVMSATPIPRALALSFYGDLTRSRLEPRGQAAHAVTTRVVGDGELDELYAFIRRRVEAGEQAYIVCPLVEDDDGKELMSARSLARRLSTGMFEGLRVGLVYGAVREAEKSKIMTQFYAGECDVLVATSLIEVGIDNPNATVMAVLNAEMFGLATLHQLRGRVGRGTADAYCFLHTGKGAENERLSALCQCFDGFEIAERDASIRGFGDFLGLRQSGGGERVTAPMLERAREICDEIFAGDISSLAGDETLTRYLRDMKNVTLS